MRCPPWLSATLAPLSLLACDNPSPAPDAGAPTASAAAPAASSAAAATASAAAGGGDAPSKLNVLFISIDALRHEMPWHGYDRDIAPNLTKLAGESVVYENAYTVSSSTAKTIGVWLGGKYPSTLYRSGYFFTAYADANVWLSEVMKPHGIFSMSGHAHKYFDRDKNLEQGFDLWEMVPDIEFDSNTDNNVTSPKHTALVLKQLAEATGKSKQFFAWYHFMDPHDQYIQHDGVPVFGKGARDRYDAEIFYTDKHIGQIIDHVRSQPWGKQTAIIVTGDHGEAFGEHDQYRHAFDLWEVLVYTPMIIHVPGATPRRIKERRSQIDLAPTILELMGVPPHEEHQGKSMAPEILGKAEPDNREPILMELPADSNNPSVRAMIVGDYKLTVYGGGFKKRLFNIKDDPAEKHDLQDREKDKLAELMKVFEETWGKLPSHRPYGGNKLTDGGTADGPESPSERAEKTGQVWR